MKEFYQSIVVEKSWQLLQKLHKEVTFVLIGGWAVFFHTKSLKSKDIDIIIDYQELSKLKTLFEVAKNMRLLKYEVKKDDVDIDIYLPHYSNVGIPIQDLLLYQEPIEGYKVLQKEALLLTKQTAYHARKESVKGKKDLIDMVSLLLLPNFNFTMYGTLIVQFRLEQRIEDLISILQNTKSIPELGLNIHSFKKKKSLVLKNLESITEDLEAVASHNYSKRIAKARGEKILVHLPKI